MMTFLLLHTHTTCDQRQERERGTHDKEHKNEREEKLLVRHVHPTCTAAKNVATA